MSERARRLESDARLCRTSLELKVQDITVFIMNYGAHGPWNVTECEGRNMTKGKNKTHEECSLRR